MLDRTIALYNMILRCDSYKSKSVVLPRGFFIVGYKHGYEDAWAKLECSIGDFVSFEDAKKYFVASYLYDQKRLNNILFIVNENNTVVGSCIAWEDERKNYFVPSLHWLVIDEKYQGIGLGKALCCAVMNIFKEQDKFPVYIHTQPWSWKAVLLYLSLGFKLQKNDTFSHYKNEYYEAMSELKHIVTEEQFRLLQELSDS